jgi:hypothetical protein
VPKPAPEPPRERAHPTHEAAAPPAEKAVAAAPARVAVSINATPWAIVRVDGREVGETPLAGIELEPGPHVFSARMPDGTMREQLVDVDGAHTTVVFQ